VIFTGSLVLVAQPAEIWATLLDVDAVAGCVPCLQSATQIDDRTFDGVIEATVGPISGKFSFRAHIVESDPPRELVARFDGTDSVTKSAVNGDTTVELSVLDAGRTELSYRSSVSVAGRLAILGEIVLRAAGNLLLKETTERLKKRIEAGAPAG
jgi:uncharacterized protein